MKEHVCRIVKLGTMHLTIWLHTAVNPTTEQWLSEFDRIAAYRDRFQTDADNTRLLAVTDGAAPGMHARSRMARDLVVKSAVVTTVLVHPLKRGIATALTWLNPRYRFMHPAQFRAALAHLDLGAYENDVWNLLVDMEKELPHIFTLDLIANTNNLPREVHKT